MRIIILFIFFFSSAIAFCQDVNELYKQGQKKYDAKKYQEAIELYTKVIGIKKDHVNGFLQRGFCYSLTGDFDKAVADFSSALELKPNHIWALENRGSSLTKVNKLDEAILDYNRLIELAPGTPEPYKNRGFCKKKQNDHDGACQDWKMAKKLGSREAKIILKNNRCK